MDEYLADSVIVLDFETTGLSPDMGDRAIEIGAVLIRNGEVCERFQSLMNPGRRINSFIEDYTGITNAMLSDAPSCAKVMADFADFIQGHNLVAHNASFDQRFLDAELSRLSAGYQGKFACSMLLARRVYQSAPNHKLGSLVSYKQIANDGVFHRALADAEMTGLLWLVMLEDLRTQYGLQSPKFGLLRRLTRTPKAQLAKVLEKHVISSAGTSSC